MWFKVDDNLAFHAKVLAAGNAAMGLWVRAGSWSGQQLTDGFVPSHVALVLGSAEEAGALVAAGLWHEADGGFQFHEWDGRQPSRSEVEARREADAERKRVAREARANQRGVQGGVRAESERPSDGSPDERPTGIQPESALSRPDPTRPDPTLTDAPDGASAGARAPRSRGTRIPDPFVVTAAMREWASTEVPHVNVDASTRRFVDYWRGVPGAKGTKLDWLATWRNWLRKDAEPGAARAGRPGAVEAGLSLVAAAEARESATVFELEPTRYLPAPDARAAVEASEALGAALRARAARRA